MRSALQTRAAHLAAALVACALAALCMVVPAGQAHAADLGPIEVTVGYFGGPYYTKQTLSAKQIEKLMKDTNGGEVVEYSIRDAGHFLRKGFAKGVYLDDLLANVGIEPGLINTFYFVTDDNYVNNDEGEPTKQWTYESLIGSKRYYYPTIKDYYDYKNLELPKKSQKEVERSGQRVQSMIALKYSSQRIGSADDPTWDDDSLMRSSLGYRLMFGQPDALAKEAKYSAHSITGIKVTYNGHPTILVSQSELAGEIGQSFEVTYALDSADTVISQSGLADITWTTADESIARVTNLGAGRLQVDIVGEGSTSLVASFGDASYEGAVSATVGVAGAAPVVEEPEKPAGEGGDGDGDGAGGKESGSGGGGDTTSGSGGNSNEGEAHNPGHKSATTLPGEGNVPIQLASGSAGEQDASAQAAPAEGSESSPARVRELDYEQMASIQEMPDLTGVAVAVGGFCIALLALGIAGHALWFSVMTHQRKETNAIA